MKRVARASLVSMIPLMLLGACASAGTSGSNRGDYDVLSRDQILSVEVANLYEVVQRLRPRWLRTRGATTFGEMMSGANAPIVVFQNQTLLGGADALRRLAPEVPYQMQYLDGSTAAATLPGLGSRAVEAAIVIYTSAEMVP